MMAVQAWRTDEPYLASLSGPVLSPAAHLSQSAAQGDTLLCLCTCVSVRVHACLFCRITTTGSSVSLSRSRAPCSALKRFLCGWLKASGPSVVRVRVLWPIGPPPWRGWLVFL